MRNLEIWKTLPRKPHKSIYQQLSQLSNSILVYYVIEVVSIIFIFMSVCKLTFCGTICMIPLIFSF